MLVSIFMASRTSKTSPTCIAWPASTIHSDDCAVDRAAADLGLVGDHVLTCGRSGGRTDGGRSGRQGDVGGRT